ncbi:MAG TPA: T9SS type A sorting domain-containing protein [Flavisolibacter sp.]|jgi:hypothetical protein|nr:T9SS type A sorting domain-containing protein [Flavisolibacter sp.]
MKTFYVLCFLFFCLSLNAQFSYGYAPVKWTTTLTPGSSGSVNASGAPASITITGSDGASATNMDVDYTITAKASGPFSFSWSYHTNDTDKDPQYDLAGVLINGAFTQLSVNTLNLVNQSGSWSGTVTAGTVIGFRLRATDNVFGNATFTISNFSPPGGVLPVNLLSFDAQKQNTAVQLVWTTASEKFFSHFIVERSATANDFSTLQTIKATSGAEPYTAIDQHPLPGTNFYRLKMVDDDGTYTYSKTIAVNTANSVSAISISPNPAANHCTLQMEAAAAASETIIIINATGSIVHQQKLYLQTGTNHFLIDISGLAKGIYFVQLKNSSAVLQLVKQ